MILCRPSFDRAYGKLTPQQRERVNAALVRFEETFGQPHSHAGIGIRSVGSFFECRGGLDLRVLFAVRDGDLVLVTAGQRQLGKQPFKLRHLLAIVRMWAEIETCSGYQDRAEFLSSGGHKSRAGF